MGEQKSGMDPRDRKANESNSTTSTTSSKDVGIESMKRGLRQRASLRLMQGGIG